MTGIWGATRRLRFRRTTWIGLGVVFMIALMGSLGAAQAYEGPPQDNACTGAFNGNPVGSLGKVATRDGVVLPNNAEVTAGETITFVITWAQGQWEGDTVDKLLDCFTVNGAAYTQLDFEWKPTANDGSEEHQITIPELKSGDVLCDRARLSGDPTGSNPSTQKSNSFCLKVKGGGNGEVPNEPEPGKIIIRKETVPNGAARSFAFTGAIGTVLSDGQEASVDVDPGTHTVTEAVNAGWKLITIECDDADSTGDVDTRVATFKVDTKETVTCVFTNQQDPEVLGGRPPLPATGDHTTVLLAVAMWFLSAGGLMSVVGRRAEG